MVTALATQARARELPVVADALERIVAAERLLSPMEQLFSWVQGRHRERMSRVIAEISETWPRPLARAADATDHVIAPPIFDVYGEGDVLTAFTRVRSALTAGDWSDAVHGVIHLNALTMRRRGGDAWVKVDRDQLDVRLAAEAGPLPAPESLERDLVHSFYLDPLRRLIVAWEDGQHV
jgi:hypothetical protein